MIGIVLLLFFGILGLSGTRIGILLIPGTKIPTLDFGTLLPGLLGTFIGVMMIVNAQRELKAYKELKSIFE